MINFLKKLFNIKEKPVNIKTKDPLAEVINKAWETGDIVIYENGQIKTIPQKNKFKDN